MIVLWLALGAGLLVLIQELRRPKGKGAEAELNRMLSSGKITPAEYRSRMAAMQRHPKVASKV